jgi:hypothetical protein
MVGLTGFDLSTWGEGGQKSIILIFLDFLLGQGTASSLSSLSFLGGNLTERSVSIRRIQGGRYHVNRYSLKKPRVN